MFVFNAKVTKFVATLVGSVLALTLLNPVQAALAFTPPVMATINPASGTVTGGDLITLTGQNLRGVTDIKVGENTVRRSETTKSPIGEWITFRAPYSAVTGKVDVTLLADVNVTEPLYYTYTASGITSVSPNSGTYRGGTTVTINGTGFGPMAWGDGSLIVKFNGVTATGVKRVSPTQITAITPTGTKGSANLEISFANAGGVYGSYSANVISATGLYTFTPEVLAPKVDAISPDRGIFSGGTQVTITGRYLRGSDNNGATFNFGGQVATNVVVSQDGLSATMTTPAHAAGAVDVLASNNDASSTTANGFTYANAPTISAVSPATGVINGGTSISISGTNFGATGMPTVKVGGKLALCVKLVSPTQITAVTRDNNVGPVDVEVAPTTGGGSATKSGGYTYQTPAFTPTVSSITPDSGPVAGANTVDIKTDGVWPAGNPTVLFGSVCALSATRIDNKTIRATVPSNPAGARDVSLTFADGYAKLASGYNYFIPTPPEVTSVTPAVDWTIGGAAVTITGVGFGATGTPTVKFGGVSATNIVRVSDTQITANVPANTVGAKDVVVTPVGQNAITKTGGFTYKAPIINSVTPNSGLFSGGINVTIYGDGFGLTGTPLVTFNGKSATSIVRVDANTITAVTPAGTTGFANLSVTPAGGTSISNNNVFAYFALQIAPQINASSVTWLPTAGGTPVTVTGAYFIGSDNKPGKVYINGTLTPATVAADGKSVTFNSPVLSPGSYEFRITTNEGSAWRVIFRVAGAPGGGSGGCDVTTGGGRNIDNGGNRTIYLANNALKIGDLGLPTVTVNGTSATVVTAGTTSGNNPRDYVTFTIPTAPAVELGAVTIVVTMGQNAGSISDSCFYRRAPMTINADDKTIMFGQNPGVFTKTVVGERASDKVTTVTLTFTGIDGTNYPSTTTVPTNAGRYQIRPSNASMSPGNIANYDWYYYDGVFVIQGIPVTITATNCTAKIYGDANPALSYTQEGLPGTETITPGSVTYLFTGTVNTGAAYGPTTSWPTHVGNYTIKPQTATLVSGNTASISFTYVSCNYQIAPRPVSISAPDTTKIYGAADPARAWQFTDPSNKNLAPGDTTLAGPVAVERYSGQDVGTYDYVAGNIDALNRDYEITYAYWGHLSINKKHITVTGVNTTKNYCDYDPELKYSSTGLVGTDTLSGSLTRANGRNVGDYAYSSGDLNGGNNYIIDAISGGKLTITTCALDITADYQEKMYGTLDPTLTYSFTGRYSLMEGDSLTGTLTRAAGVNVGTYAINKGSLASSANYTISYHTNNLVIYKRTVCVTADDKTKVYGTADPAFTKTLLITEYCFALVGSDAITGTMSRDSGNDVGFYSITKGTLTAGSNYDVYVDSGALEITKRPITVKPAAKSKTYGDNDPGLTVTLTVGTMAYSDTLQGSINRAGGENVGTYAYILGDYVYYNPNYSITVDNTNVFTINKKHIAVTGLDSYKYYGDSDPFLDYTSTGLVWGDQLNGSLGRAAGENVGNYSYTAGTLSGGDNYIVDSISGGKLIIQKRPIYVCADYKQITYGDTAATLTYQDCGEGYWLVGSDTFSGSLDRSGGSNVGTYGINKGSLALSSNYELNFYGDDYVITPKTIYIDAANKNKIYGFGDPALTYQLTSGYAWVGADVPTINLTRTAGENVGFYTINIGTISAGTNYNIYVNSGQLEITKRPITLKPNAKSKFYGDNDPDFTAFSTGDYTVTVGSIKSGDTIVTSFGRDSGENVGSYNYTSGDLNASNSNYDITVDATNKFAINKRVITVTAEAKSKQYGETDPGLSYTTSLTSLPNGTDVSLNGDLTRAAGEAVADYTIQQGTITDGNNSNYTITYVSAKLTISKRDVSICADDKQMTYGDASKPVNSGALCDGSSFVGSDALGTLSYTYSVLNPTNAGTYTITPGSATLSVGSLGNYNISYETATLTIDPRQIHIAANDKSKQYGQNDPAFNYSIVSGALVGGDSWTGALGRESGENVGVYDITLGALTLGDNYVVTVDSGKLTINKRSVQVKPDAGQKKFYGDNDPTYKFGTNITLPYSETLVGPLGRGAGENVGDYVFNLAAMQAANPNYDLTIDTTNKFKIEKLVIVITVNNIEKFYGDADPSYTYTFSPATLGNGGSITLTGAPTRAPGENVGEYLISVGTLNAGSNYTATITSGAKLTIKKKVIRVKAGDKSSVYGANLPANTVTVSSGTMVGSESVSGASYTYSTNPPVHVGSYTITPSAATVAGGLTSNYEFIYETGALTITKADLTVYLQKSNSDWGDTIVQDGVNRATGLKNNDKVGDIAYTYNSSETNPALPGSYVLGGTVINFSSGSVADYNITVVPATYVVNAPFYMSIDPKRGPEAGGTSFTINGLGFGFDAPTVLFDGIEATSVGLVGSSQIVGLTPAHVKGLVDVTIVTAAGTYDFGMVFTYYPPVPTPQVNSLGPIDGPTTGGNKVTLSGGFLKGSDGKPAKVYIDGKLATGITVSKDGKTLTMTIPAHKAGKVDIVVSTKDGSFTFPQSYEYIPGGQTSTAYIIFGGDSSVLTAAGKAALDKLLKLIPKNAVVASVGISGWVHRTASTKIDAALSIARATVSAKYLKSKGLKGIYTLNGKGIYHLGNENDRRAEVEVVWTN